MYTEEQVIASLIRYINSEILGHLDGASKFIAGAVLIKNNQRLPELLKEYAQGAKIAGLYTSDGMIDVDSWCNALRQSMTQYCSNNVEISIPVIGRMKINSNDINTLQRYMRNEL